MTTKEARAEARRRWGKRARANIMPADGTLGSYRHPFVVWSGDVCGAAGCAESFEDAFAAAEEKEATVPATNVTAIGRRLVAP